MHTAASAPAEPTRIHYGTKRKILVTLFRVLFCGLILFEVANHLHILNFPLSFTWFGLLITSVTVLAAIEIANHILKWYWHASLHWSTWSLAFISIFIDAFGDIGHFYTRFWWYDNAAHAIGGLVACLFIFNVVKAFEKASKYQLPYAVRYIFAYAITLSVGTYYEIEEYLEDVFTGSQRSGGNADTANDLLMNAIGATLVLIILFAVNIYRVRRAKSSLRITT